MSAQNLYQFGSNIQIMFLIYYVVFHALQEKMLAFLGKQKSEYLINVSLIHNTTFFLDRFC